MKSEGNLAATMELGKIFSAKEMEC
jgi:hypothetical protein